MKALTASSGPGGLSEDCGISKWKDVRSCVWNAAVNWQSVGHDAPFICTAGLAVRGGDSKTT